MAKSNERALYLSQACAEGKFNGQVATASGPKTSKSATMSQIDAPQQNSKAGSVKKGQIVSPFNTTGK